jgi:cell wall-associated NlpC family hydrolase
MTTPHFTNLQTVLMLLIALVLCVGIAGNARAAEENTTQLEPSQPTSTFGKLLAIREKAADLAENAMSMLGIRYKRGGNTPENGLDCSGFVRYVFKNSLGTNLPRTSLEISKVGEKVDQKDLQPGDLVFYNTLRKGFSHVGIYLGDNKFIHSPSAGGQVRIESMDLAYWKKRFNGARRVEDLHSSEAQ